MADSSDIPATDNLYSEIEIEVEPELEQTALDEFWMQHALELAKRAEAEGEVPVGAVLVKDDQVIAEGWNQSITLQDPTAHAEVVALRNAANKLANYRLNDTTLYVTLEPCCMCAGAMVHARVKRVVYGANDPKTGASGSVFTVLNSELHNHRIDILPGVLAEECSQVLKEFFKSKRK